MADLAQQRGGPSTLAANTPLHHSRDFRAINNETPTPLFSSVHLHRSHKRRSRRQRLHDRLCSLPVVVTLIYFFFLLCVAVIVTTTTEAKITEVLLGTWSSVHSVNVRRVGDALNSVAAMMANISVTAASLYTQSSHPIESNTTLAVLCATLAMTDQHYTVRTLSLGNVPRGQYAGVFHGDPLDPALRNITVLLSNHNHFYGLFYVDPYTYEYYEPPIMKSALNQSLTAQDMMSQYASTDPLFARIDEFLNRTNSELPMHLVWNTPPSQPSFMYLTFPVFFLGRSLLRKKYVDAHDYVQVRVDGSALLRSLSPSGPALLSRVMVLANRTLNSSDPIVLSNNWRQVEIHNASYAIAVNTNTTYLKVSNISDPLMREAVRHVDLKALQHNGYNVTTVFRYHGAPAIVTAWVHTTQLGLSLPMVVVSPQHAVTGPYLTVRDVCCGMVAVAAVLLTALCYFAMDRYLSRPLRRVSAAMVASVRRGVRQPVRADACDVVQLTEVRELTAAYNAAVAQLRVVDEFVLADAAPLHELHSRYLTVLTVRLRPFSDRCAAPRAVVVQQRQLLHGGHGGGIVDAAAVTDGGGVMTSSSPFACAADVAAFVGAVRRLSVEHHGTVHRLVPDTCVLHFGAAACGDDVSGGDGRAAVPRCTRRRIAQDARDALAFGFALLHWTDHSGSTGMPDVRVLVDTGVFTCGPYRAPGSEQTLSVALGRDVERSVGHVPALIGVRVAMTEETASCVHGGMVGSVRQLPVEALRTGRVGLDADVVILYEALPGPAAGDAAWLHYAECAFDGFSCMLRGDYAAALTAFAGVADIADLEVGLLPSRFRREAAARCDVTGGAVSMQVERLMTECERRVATHWTQGFHRTPVRPLGIDVVLASLAQQRSALRNAAAGQLEKRRGRYGLDVRNPRAPCSAARIVAVLPGTSIRTTYSAAPATVQDNWGHEWCIGQAPAEQRRWASHLRYLPVLSSSGTRGVVQLLLYRDVPPVVTAALAGVPEGPLRDMTRGAVPFWLPSSVQREAVHKLFGPCLRLRHANVLTCLGYSIAYEGGVVVVSESIGGNNLREMRALFPGTLSQMTIARLGCSVLRGLLFLHANGIVHGELRPECVLVCSDGACRLKGFYTDYALAHRVLCLPRTCYVSPEVAAGQPPTPASDVFGYGLVMLELATQKLPWAWAPVVGEGPQRCAEDLAVLAAAGGDTFSALVAQRLVVPAVDRLDMLSSSDSSSTASAYVVRRCVEWEVDERITVREALNGTIRAGKLKRAHVVAQHSLLHFGNSDDDNENSSSSNGALVQLFL